MYLVGILIGILFIISVSRKHEITPLIIFSGLWTIILLLSAFRLYGLDEPSTQSYTVISIGMLGFGIGSLICGNKIIKLHGGNSVYQTRERLIWVLVAATIILYFVDFTKIATYLINGQTLAYIRAISQDGTSILYSDRSNLEVAIRSFIIQPFALAFQVIVAKEFWNGKRKWLVVDIVIITLRVLSEGSRSLFVYLGLNLIIIFFMDNKMSYYIEAYKVNKNRRKRTLKIIIFAVLILSIATTLSRSGERMLRSTYYYFSMEPTMLSMWLKNIKEYGYGLASINGLVFPLLFVLKNALGFSNYPSYWYNNIFLLIDDTDKTWKIISSFDSTRANAYVSIFWFAYLDGGYIGVFVILFILGMIYGFFHNYTKKHRNNKNVCIYAYLLQGLLFSFVRLQFADVSYMLGFLFLLFFAFGKSRRGITSEK